MKKTLKNVCLFMLLLGTLLSTASAVTLQTTLQSDTTNFYPHQLIGTWHEDSAFLPRALVFREDGTGLRGSSGGRREMEWTLENDVIYLSGGIGGFRYPIISLEDGILVVSYISQAAGQLRTYYRTYIFYSEAIDLYGEERWQQFTGLPAIGIAIAFFVWRAKKKHSRSRRIGDDL